MSPGRPARISRRKGGSILVYAPEDAARYAQLIRAPRGVQVHVASNAAEAQPVLADVDVLYAWKFPSALFAKTERLTWLHVMGAGVDWAFVPELPARVQVTRTPGVFGPWMAEYVVGWCSWVTQRMTTYRDSQRQRQWIGTLPDRLRGKTLVVVGLGDIGRTVARAARSLGVRVLGVSRSGRPVREAERVYRTRDLRAALARADFVVLVLPLTPETRGMVGPDELAALRPGAWLINIARGAIVDEEALLEALQARRLGGAILDVFNTEPLPSGHPFWGLDNVVVTPHIAGPSTPEELAPVFNDNLTRFLTGRALRHVVDRARGY
jgi:phosphoglycerate dehydrogenase-like enzyme